MFQGSQKIKVIINVCSLLNLLFSWQTIEAFRELSVHMWAGFANHSHFASGWKDNFANWFSLSLETYTDELFPVVNSIFTWKIRMVCKWHELWPLSSCQRNILVDSVCILQLSSGKVYSTQPEILCWCSWRRQNYQKKMKCLWQVFYTVLIFIVARSMVLETFHPAGPLRHWTRTKTDYWSLLWYYCFC